MIYLSFPMTHASEEDNVIINETIVRIERLGVPHYNPRTEPADLTMDQVQLFDFEKMSASGSGQLVIWTPGAHKSAGVIEEMGWARRIFGRKIAVYMPRPVFMSSWTRATARQKVFETLEPALEYLQVYVSKEVADGEED